MAENVYRRLRTVQRLKPTQFHSHIGQFIITGVHRTDTNAVNPDRRNRNMTVTRPGTLGSESVQNLYAFASCTTDQHRPWKRVTPGMMDMAELQPTQTGQETAQNPCWQIVEAVSSSATLVAAHRKESNAAAAPAGQRT